MSNKELRSALDISLSCCISSSLKNPDLAYRSYYHNRALSILSFAGFSGIVSRSEEQFLERALSCIM